MFCSKCGFKVEEGNTFCGNCGNNMNSGSYVNNQNDIVIPEEYKPISMWGYFGYEILFSIPIIGFIILIVYAFGGTNNINLKNFARSYFCILIIIFVIGIITTVFLGIGVSMYGIASSR